MALIAIGDSLAPLGVAVYIVYLVPLVLAFFAGKSWMPVLVAAVATVLSIATFLFTPGDVNRDVFRISRGFGILTFWMVASVGFQFIRNRQSARLENRIRTGQARLAERLSGEQPLDELCGNVLSFLSDFLGVNASAMFVKQGPAYHQAATCGTLADAVPSRVVGGEGLLGQAIKEHRMIWIDEVPDGYLNVASSLGKALPRQLLIVPVSREGQVNAVMELGFFRPVTLHDRLIMERMEPMIAVAIASQKYRQRLKELLEETQQQSEEVQAQSEELRVTNEELEERGRVLKESQARMELQQTEMEQINNQLEQQTLTLLKQKDELLVAKTALENQARLVEQASRYKSDFLANMSHELRTPLNSSLILAKLLADNAPGNLTDEQIKYARTIEAAGNDLLALINDVLDLSKVEAGHLRITPEPVLIQQIVQGLRDRFEPVARQKSLPLEIEMSADLPPTIHTDVQRLQQILKNFLSNAVKFTDRGKVALAVGYLLKPVKREELVKSFRELENRMTRKVRRLLLVEDDPVQLEAMRDLLGSHDVEAVAASGAAECLEQLKSTTFDCMVLDLSLPDASGFKLLETLSSEEAYSFPPVIVYTGRDLSPDEEQRLRRYSESIIIKGAKSPERLLDEVSLFLQQVVSELPPEKQQMIRLSANRDSMLEGRRILVVEDDVRNVCALGSMLESRGMKYQIARNGREAIETLEQSLQPGGEPVDLVLMDIMIPEMDGLPAMRKIRERPEWKKLPIIALTAKAMTDDQRECLEAGASDFLAKPLDVDKLLSLLRVWMPR